MDLSLRAYLEGLVAVLAYRDRRRVPLQPGVFDAALEATIAATSKQAARERIHLRFRIQKDALMRPTSTLARVIRTLTRDGVWRLDEDQSMATVQWTQAQAHARLAEDDLPVGYLERSARVFVKQAEARRIQQTLRGLAGRRR